MGDRTSRDANDPRDELRAMNKQARSEMEDDEMGQTGGQERSPRVTGREGELGHARREPDASGRKRVPGGEESGTGRATGDEEGTEPRPSPRAGSDR
jgi:hypothetical protein